jgi:hypothetical protein
MPRRRARVDFVMEVLRCDALQQFLQGNVWWPEGGNEQLPVVQRHIDKHALFKM